MLDWLRFSTRYTEKRLYLFDVHIDDLNLLNRFKQAGHNNSINIFPGEQEMLSGMRPEPTELTLPVRIREGKYNSLGIQPGRLRLDLLEL